jgi:hypothetical protein
LNEDLNRIARRRAGAKLGLYIHAAVVLLAASGLRERMEAEELRRLQ